MSPDEWSRYEGLGDSPTARTFWKLHYDLMENDAFIAFLGLKSCPTFIFLLAHVFRGSHRHPEATLRHELHPFYWDEHWLCTRVSAGHLAREHYRQRRQREISRDIEELEEMGLIDTYPWSAGTVGEAQLIQVGNWDWVQERGKRHGQERAEVLYIDRVFRRPDL